MPETKFHTITLTSQDKTLECNESDTILECGLLNGLAMRYECNNGTCGACKARLIHGKLAKIKHHDYVLSAHQLNRSEFLMCCNAPRSDIEILPELIGDVRHIEIQQIQAKLTDIQFINDNMAIIKLRTPRYKTLQFMAGQDVELSYQGAVARYPVASCPCHGIALEFHIRKIDADDFSQAIFSKQLNVKDKIDLVGPKGVFVLKEHSNKPMLFIAWDSGFAPIRSLVEHALSLEMNNPVHFYWAYPAIECKPYLDNHAQSWQALMDDYHYTSIGCEFDRNHLNNCHKVAQQIYNSLDHQVVNLSEVYICAPAEVLIYLGELLLNNGLDESQLIASPI